MSTVFPVGSTYVYIGVFLLFFNYSIICISRFLDIISNLKYLSNGLDFSRLNLYNFLFFYLYFFVSCQKKFGNILPAMTNGSRAFLPGCRHNICDVSCFRSQYRDGCRCTLPWAPPSRCGMYSFRISLPGTRRYPHAHTASHRHRRNQGIARFRCLPLSGILSPVL